MNLTPAQVENLPTNAKDGDLVLMVVRWDTTEAASVFVGGFNEDQDGNVILATGTDFEAFDMMEVETTYVLPADQFENDEDYDALAVAFATYMVETGKSL